MLAVFLDTTVLFVAFPDIVSSFETVAPTQLSWVLNGYTIVFAALLIPAGKFADRTGHKRTFIGGSVVFTIGSLLCALAPSANLLIAFRVVQAVGAAALLPASLALVLRAFPAAKVPLAVAIWGSTGALAGALGPTLGAILVEVGSWHWVFLINIPIGLFTIVVGRRVLDESSDPDAVVPAPLGVVLIAAAAALISLGVVQSDTWGWSDPRTIAALTAGSAILALFIVQQRRTQAPVLDLELFRIRNFAWGNSATLAFSMAFTAMFFSSILFLTQVWNYSTITAGLAVAPGPLIVAVLAPVMGTLAGRIGQRPMLITGGLLFAAGGAWRLVMLGGPSRLPRRLPPLDDLHRTRRGTVPPAAVERRGAVAATEPVRRRRWREPGDPSVRRNPRRRTHHRLRRLVHLAGQRAVELRQGLVAAHHRWRPPTSDCRSPCAPDVPHRHASHAAHSSSEAA